MEQNLKLRIEPVSMYCELEYVMERY